MLLSSVLLVAFVELDELAAIDDLKERIDALLDSPAALPAADQPE